MLTGSPVQQSFRTFDNRCLNPEFFPEGLSQRRSLGIWRQLEGRHRSMEPRPRGGSQLQAQSFADTFANIAHQFCDAGTNASPAQAGLKIDRSRNRQPGAKVTCSFELEGAQSWCGAELILPLRMAPVVVPAPAYLQGLQALLAAGPEIQESRSRRGEHPLVTIGAVEIGADAVQVDIDHRGGMGAVDHCQNAALPRLRTKLLGRKHEAGRRQDVTEEQQTCVWRERRPSRIDYFARRMRHHR